jgi:hypothetical protein
MPALVGVDRSFSLGPWGSSGSNPYVRRNFWHYTWLCVLALFYQAGLSEPIDDRLEIGGVLVWQHLAAVLERIVGVDAQRLPPFFARLVETSHLPVGRGQKDARSEDRQPTRHAPRVSMRRTREEVSPMTEAPSKSKIVLAQVVVALVIAFVGLGLAWYGFSADVRQRIWQNLLDRPFGR